MTDLEFFREQRLQRALRLRDKNHDDMEYADSRQDMASEFYFPERERRLGRLEILA